MSNQPTRSLKQAVKEDIVNPAKKGTGAVKKGWNAYKKALPKAAPALKGIYKFFKKAKAFNKKKQEVKPS